MTQPSISKSEDKEKIVINITDDDHGWVERIGKTARNRIKLNEQHTGFILESNDAAILGCISWAIEQHLDDIPTKLKPSFQQILNDIKDRKENLERS